MLALVSSITTAVNGCDSLENCVISTGLPLSMTRSRRAAAPARAARGVDDRGVDGHLGPSAGAEDLWLLFGRRLRGRILAGLGGNRQTDEAKGGELQPAVHSSYFSNPRSAAFVLFTGHRGPGPIRGRLKTASCSIQTPLSDYAPRASTAGSCSRRARRSTCASRSFVDTRFRKYPPLPRHSLRGYEAQPGQEPAGAGQTGFLIGSRAIPCNLWDEAGLCGLLIATTLACADAESASQGAAASAAPHAGRGVAESGRGRRGSGRPQDHAQGPGRSLAEDRPGRARPASRSCSTRISATSSIR